VPFGTAVVTVARVFDVSKRVEAAVGRDLELVAVGAAGGTPEERRQLGVSGAARRSGRTGGGDASGLAGAGEREREGGHEGGESGCVETGPVPSAGGRRY
jgi:hypothetical protein